MTAPDRSALEALIQQWRALSQERVYPYGKLMKPWAQDAFKECADELEAALLLDRGAPPPIDVEAMRANLHATFNGGWQESETIRAFHHGMDTVCNVLAAKQKGEGTNGIFPAGADRGAPPRGQDDEPQSDGES